MKLLHAAATKELYDDRGLVNLGVSDSKDLQSPNPPSREVRRNWLQASGSVHGEICQRSPDRVMVFGDGGEGYLLRRDVADRDHRALSRSTWGLLELAGQARKPPGVRVRIDAANSTKIEQAGAGEQGACSWIRRQWQAWWRTLTSSTRSSGRR